MFHIDNNGVIEINRGDRASTPLFINRGTIHTPVRFSILANPGAAVYLRVFETCGCVEHTVLEQRYDEDSDINDNGDLILRFEPEDTACLEPGRYLYEIELRLLDGKTETVVPKKEFYVIA